MQAEGPRMYISQENHEQGYVMTYLRIIQGMFSRNLVAVAS